MSLLADYLTELRTIRNLAAGVAETSYYSALSALIGGVGKTLKPKVLYLPHPQNTGGGIPDAGFFTSTQTQQGTPRPGQKPARGILEAKPFTHSLDALTQTPQVLLYLQTYSQVLITNLRQFRLLILVNNQPQTVESYTLAPTADALFLPETLKQHAELFQDFLARVLRRQATLIDPGDLAWFLASYAREARARARAEQHSLLSISTIKQALEQSLGLHFEGEKGEHFFRSTLFSALRRQMDAPGCDTQNLQSTLHFESGRHYGQDAR